MCSHLTIAGSFLLKLEEWFRFRNTQQFQGPDNVGGYVRGLKLKAMNEFKDGIKKA
jgi:hypothetical protein